MNCSYCTLFRRTHVFVAQFVRARAIVSNKCVVVVVIYLATQSHHVNKNNGKVLKIAAGCSKNSRRQKYALTIKERECVLKIATRRQNEHHEFQYNIAITEMAVHV